MGSEWTDTATGQRLPEAVYVLHVFQKKSRRGAETPKPDMMLIEKRLRDATELYEAVARRKEKG